jgi:aryl-alcohol dehydrogenase-like predicted oxidoreductase
MDTRSARLDRAIPGTTKLHRLEENIGAADVELTADD